MTSDAMMANGMSFCGFFVSSATVEMASNPMYAKKITNAPSEMPSNPLGANGVQLSGFTNRAPTTMNSSTMAILRNTEMLFTHALSLMPMTSTQVMSATIATAGRL